MGRAQVMQAEAAGIEPAAIMNPILLEADERYRLSGDHQWKTNAE